MLTVDYALIRVPLNSKDNIDVWRKKLSKEQLSVIRNTTKDSGSVFYPEFY